MDKALLGLLRPLGPFSRVGSREMRDARILMGRDATRLARRKPWATEAEGGCLHIYVAGLPCLFSDALEAP